MTESAPVPSPADPEGHTIRVQQLFVKHQGSIKAFILSLHPDFAEADDILQETFLTVTRKAGAFSEGTSFIAWSFAIARFKTLEARRRRPAHHQDLSDEVLEALAAAAPDETFFDRRLAALRQCLERLAPTARAMVRLRYHEEHGPEEIAQLLSWKPNAVNVALSRARSALRTCVRRQTRETA